jgi:hypothetical protein
MAAGQMKDADTIVAGATGISIFVILRKKSDNTVLTGVVAADVTGSYCRVGTAVVTVVVTALASVSTAWVSGGFVEISSTMQPGMYRYDAPDAAHVTGVNEVSHALVVATTYNAYRVFAITTDQVQTGDAYANAAAATALASVANALVTQVAQATALVSVANAIATTVAQATALATLSGVVALSTQVDSVETSIATIINTLATGIAQATALATISNLMAYGTAVASLAQAVATTVAQATALATLSGVVAQATALATLSGVVALATALASVAVAVAAVSGTMALSTQVDALESQSSLIVSIWAAVDTEIAALTTSMAALVSGVTVSGTVALSAAERTAICSAIMAHSMGNARTVGQALAFLRNKWVIAAGVLTVYDTDDTSVLWTAAITTAAGDPVTSVDP